MDFKLLAIVALVCVVNQQVGAHVVSKRAEKDEGVPPPVALEVLLTQAANSQSENALIFDGHQYMVRSEYDILYTLEQWAEMHSTHRQKRTAGIIERYSPRWTNNLVPYEVAEHQMTSNDMNSIRQSLENWEHFTCVKFKKDSEAMNRLRLQDAGGCYSRLGMVGGVQVVGLARGCRIPRIIMHELAHALGIHHEQTRPDRDDHVTILFDNIDPEMAYNFLKLSPEDMVDTNHTYDYMSIMHYSDRSFSNNGKQTILTKDPEFQDKIGHYQDLSFGDIKTVNLMYNCRDATEGCQLQDADCGPGGFVGKDCACWCKGNPVQYCFEEDRKNRSDPFKMCRDKNNYCDSYKASGSCSKYKNWMKKNCRKTCGEC